jgi:hypothetical protein
MTPPPSIDRLYDLLVRQATEPLALADEAELARLSAKWPHVDLEAFHLTAAALDRATAPAPPDPLPDPLRQRLEEDAAAYFATPPARRESFRVREAGLGSRGRKWGRAVWTGSGWAVAASILLVGGGVALLRPSLPRELSLLERREQLRPGAARFVSPPGQPTAEVVWNPATQQGVLEVTGLRPNDPAKSQYQLWVFDGERAAQGQNRVDAGVFDVGPDGKAVIPVNPALKVFNATAFAVTEETPGGVIVSNVPASVRVLLAAAPPDSPRKRN